MSAKALDMGSPTPRTPRSKVTTAASGLTTGIQMQAPARAQRGKAIVSCDDRVRRRFLAPSAPGPGGSEAGDREGNEGGLLAIDAEQREIVPGKGAHARRSGLVRIFAAAARVVCASDLREQVACS